MKPTTGNIALRGNNLSLQIKNASLKGCSVFLVAGIPALDNRNASLDSCNASLDSCNASLKSRNETLDGHNASLDSRNASLNGGSVSLAVIQV